MDGAVVEDRGKRQNLHPLIDHHQQTFLHTSFLSSKRFHRLTIILAANIIILPVLLQKPVWSLASTSYCSLLEEVLGSLESYQSISLSTRVDIHRSSIPLRPHRLLADIVLLQPPPEPLTIDRHTGTTFSLL